MYLISLGYSCQTRFSIDAVTFDFLRRPFDFNITTQTGLIKAFISDGQSLILRPQDLSVFTMSLEKRQGIESNGIYFWHDFPIEPNGRKLSDDWQNYIESINEKNAKIWPRFVALLRSGKEKTIVVTNSQINLHEFSSDEADFELKFGLGPDAYSRINHALVDFGVQNFKLKFLTRSLSDMERCSEQISSQHFECQFVGKLSLPFENSVAFSLVDTPHTDINQACGFFDGAQKLVKRVSDRSALIYRRNPQHYELWGSLRAMPDGYLACFEGENKVFKAVRDANELYFSNRARWMSDPDA